MRAPILVVTLAQAGCRPPEPAPIELDDLAHFFLAQVDLQEHERIVEGAANLLAWYDASGLAGQGPSNGTLTDLAQEEVDVLTELNWHPDPEPCAGVFAVSEITCDLATVEAMNLEPEQTEVFEGNYESYVRTWESDPACFEAGTCDGLDWSSVIEDNFVFSYEMTYTMYVRMRRTRDEDGAPAALLIRSVMTDPAQEDVDVGGFEQSYHIEAYVPRAGGLLHLYGMWSYGWISGSDPDSDFWSRQYSDGLLDFEDQLQGLCENGW